MTKSQLITLVAQGSPHLPKKDVESAVNTVFGEMRLALHRDERIEIRGFGSFSVKRRSPREGRNPKTGETVFVPTRRKAVFSAGREIRDRLNLEPLQ